MVKVVGPDLKRYMDKRLALKLNGNRKVSGVLRGFDQFMNVTLDETVEEVSATESNRIGMVVSRETLFACWRRANAWSRFTNALMRSLFVWMWFFGCRSFAGTASCSLSAWSGFRGEPFCDVSTSIGESSYPIDSDMRQASDRQGEPRVRHHDKARD